MIADGCGFNHVDAASYWQYGATGRQVYESFALRCAQATSALGRNYEPALFWADDAAVQDHPTDSAAAITALTTGHKTRNKMLAITPEGEELPTLVERMEEGGRATGVVSSVLFTHATPAGTTVRNQKRKNYAEIGAAMITASAVDVIMGPGHPLFDKQGRSDSRPDFKYVGGRDVWQDVLDGTALSDADGDGIPDPWNLIEDRQAFQDLAAGQTPRRVLGIPRIRKTLQQERDGDSQAAPGVVPTIPTVPTLVEMTRAALNILDDHPGGFFLLIEGGAVDWAGHDKQLGRMIEEQVDFNYSVQAVVDWVAEHGGWEQNLVIVTADHETGYLTGPPGTDRPGSSCRFNDPLVNRGAGKLPGFVWNSGHHTNSLVPFYAQGSGWRRFQMRAVREDPVHGPFLENTDVGQVLVELASRPGSSTHHP